MPKRTVFYLSDGTGVTAETLGRSLLTQFPGTAFQQESLPFIDSAEKAQRAVERIDRAAERDGTPPLLFTTLIDPALRAVIAAGRGVLLDFFEAFNATLERELGEPSSHVVGLSHGMGDQRSYTARINALNFALANDDGVTTRNYPHADVILLGVSRSGKTPTCLYLALHYGVLAANYPITEEDMASARLPKALELFRDKLFGLTIDAERLQQIRSERLPNSRYAALDQCRRELAAVAGIYRAEGIRFLDTTSKSIEEIAATLLQQAALERRLIG